MTTTSFASRPSLPRIASLVLAVALLLASGGAAGAATITYRFVDYPAYQSDFFSGGTISVSGTFITDGFVGVIDPNNYFDHVLGGTMIFVAPDGTQLTGDLIGGFGWDPGHDLFLATPTHLLMPAGYGISLNWRDFPSLDDISFSWIHYPANGQQYQYNGGASKGGVTPVGWFFNDSASLALGTPSPDDPWVIASVPEPSGITLLSIAGVRLLTQRWQRRRKLRRTAI